MKNIIVTSVLLLLVLFIFGFIIMYLGFHVLPPDNWVNLTLRREAIKNPIAVRILRLEDPGDARYIYMQKSDRPLTIYLYYQDGINLIPETIRTVSQKINTLTQRSSRITIYPPVIMKNIPDKVTDRQVAGYISDYKIRASLKSNPAVLHIFLFKYYLTNSSIAGLAAGADTIVIFKQPLIYVSADQNMMTTNETSAVLHQFGHLLGAGNITKSGCVMSDITESLNYYQKISATDTYCREDLNSFQEAI